MDEHEFVALAEERVLVVNVKEFVVNIRVVEEIRIIFKHISVWQHAVCGDATAQAVFRRECQSLLVRRVDDRVAAGRIHIV